MSIKYSLNKYMVPFFVLHLFFVFTLPKCYIFFCTLVCGLLAIWSPVELSDLLSVLFCNIPQFMLLILLYTCLLASSSFVASIVANLLSVLF